jgi:hypothetical protein
LPARLTLFANAFLGAPSSSRIVDTVSLEASLTLWKGLVINTLHDDPIYTFVFHTGTGVVRVEALILSTGILYIKTIVGIKNTCALVPVPEIERLAESYSGSTNRAFLLFQDAAFAGASSPLVSSLLALSLASNALRSLNTGALVIVPLSVARAIAFTAALALTSLAVQSLHSERTLFRLTLRVALALCRVPVASRTLLSSLYTDRVGNTRAFALREDKCVFAESLHLASQSLSTFTSTLVFIKLRVKSFAGDLFAFWFLNDLGYRSGESAIPLMELPKIISPSVVSVTARETFTNREGVVPRLSFNCA